MGQLDWERFLSLARCPAPGEPGDRCAGLLERRQHTLVCQTCAMTYALDDTTDMPIFAPRTLADLAADKYEDPTQRIVEGYVGLWAYGYLFIHRGEAEGFYRTITELGFSTPLAVDGPHRILEIGCGVGRTACDYARHYPNAFIVGIDYSPAMLNYAYQMVVGERPGARVTLSLDQEGFGELSAPTFGLRNAFFAQANALQLPFADGQFDLVVSPNLIDRVPDPRQLLREIARMVKPGGSVIMADPFNWTKQPEWWARCQNVDDLATLFADIGLHVDVAFDGLIYREVKDKRGAFTDWPVAVVRATKGASS